MTMYFIFGAATLIALFVGTLVVEARRQARFFSTYRNQLDRWVEQASFILAHVDFASFAKEEIQRLARRASHDLAHLTLQSVRAVERLLTRLVRRLRTRHPDLSQPAGESTRSFVRTLSEFKGHLEATRPEMSDIR